MVAVRAESAVKVAVPVALEAMAELVAQLDCIQRDHHVRCM